MFMKLSTPATVSRVNSRMIGIGFLIDQEEMFFMVGAYRAAGAAAGAAGAAAGAEAGAGALMVTRSPSPRKPAPWTTTRAPSCRPLTEVWSAPRARTVTGV